MGNTCFFSDEEGNVVRVCAPIEAKWPLEILNAMTIIEDNEKQR